MGAINIMFQNPDASQNENLCKCIFVSKDRSCYCKWLVKLLQNSHISVNNVTVHCTVKNSPVAANAFTLVWGCVLAYE